MAQEAQAKRLLLTHISARYVGKDITNLVNEAKEVFPNTLIVKDFDIVEILLPERKKQMNLENKVVVVTGSAGLGEQICYEAAKRGAIVVTCARRTNLIEKSKNNVWN